MVVGVAYPSCVGAKVGSHSGRVASLLQGHIERPTTIRTHSHTYGPFRVSSSPHVRVFGLREEAGELLALH